MKLSANVKYPKGALRSFQSAPTCTLVKSRRNARIVAFKEANDIKDWRVKQMVDTCHIYYSKVWSRGDLTAVDTLLDSQFVYRDLCSAAGWVQQSACLPAAMPPTGMVVGPGAFKALLTDMRSHYPDLYVEVEELAVSDTNRIFVSWVSHGTQLGATHRDSASTPHAAKESDKQPTSSPACASAPPAATSPPSYHNSLIRGVDVITFNHDRSRLLEVNVFRQLNSDERREVEKMLAPNPLEIRLARLHWETPNK